MFIIYSLVLLIFVYTAPGLALFPKLVLSSRTIVATPFVSIGVISTTQVLLAWGGLYTRSIVLGISLAFFVVAVVRLSRLKLSPTLIYWPSTHRFLLLLTLLLSIYWASNLGTTGFDDNDEIYSWNLWAIMHYLGVKTDFYYFTKAPYPQLFPILISYCYKLLGTIELQLPVKTLFALFPLAAWSAIAVAPKEATYTNAIRSIILLLFITIAISEKFTTGYADPLMASSLVVGIYLYIQYVAQPDRRELLILSVICASVALFTKQAALIWALGSFPLIVLIATVRKKLSTEVLIAVGVLLTLGLIWVFGPGSDFQNNPGVITRSKEDRGYFEQLIFAGGHHFKAQILIPIILIACTLSAIKARKNLDIVFLFLYPALFAWLVFGSYTLRLGIHVVALSALLLAASNYSLPMFLGGDTLSAGEKFVRDHAILVLAIALLFTSVASTLRSNSNIEKIGENFSHYNSGINNISKYFGKDARFVFDKLYDKKDLLVWVPSLYIYGIFYNHTPILFPFKVDGEYNQKTLINEIEKYHPDYLFESGPRASWGPYSKQLKILAEQNCPQLFEKVAKPPNKFGYTVYRLKRNDARLIECKKSLN